MTSGGDTRRYVYDPDGRLMGEYGGSATDVIAETIWLQPEVANDNGVRGLSGGQASSAMPIGGDDGVGGYAPLAIATGSGTSPALYWLHGNHLGVPLVTTDASGAAATPTGHTLPGFPGQLRTLADLYYNRHRDYDSSTGRYIQADPIGLEGDANPYLYAFGNPLSYIDPTGEFGIVGAAIGGGIDLAEQLISNGGKWHCVNWKRVGGSAVIGAFTGGAACGAFAIKRGSHTWGATRKWLGKKGFAKKVGARSSLANRAKQQNGKNHSELNQESTMEYQPDERGEAPQVARVASGYADGSGRPFMGARRERRRWNFGTRRRRLWVRIRPVC